MATGKQSLIHIAWKGVSRKIFRNIVLVFAVGLLVGLLVFALLFKSAVEEDIDRATKRLGADIVIVPSKAKTMAEEFIMESKRKTFYMEHSVYDQIKDMDGIDASTYQIYLNTLSSGCCSIVEGQVVAIDPNTDFVVTPWMDSPKKLARNEVYVGYYVWEYMGLIETMNLFGENINMVDHLETTGTGIDHGIFMRIKDLDAITDSALGDYKKGTISIIFIKIKEGLDVNAFVGRIRDINPRVGIMTRGNIGADVRTTLEDILRVFIITISISSLLAVLLAWSTFSALANERRREVGILRALGAKKSHIVNLFLSEAFIISFLGSLIGILLGHYLIHYLAADFQLLKQLDTTSIVSSHSIIISLIGMGAGIIVCLSGAALPVLRLARLEPLLAIKEE